jgi:hypothetical protein
MTEEELKLQARLAAIEYMVANLYHRWHRLLGSTPEQIRLTHEKAREMWSRQTIPDVDPAQADMMAGEVQAAVEDILTLIEQMAGMQKGAPAG